MSSSCSGASLNLVRLIGGIRVMGMADWVIGESSNWLFDWERLIAVILYIINYAINSPPTQLLNYPIGRRRQMNARPAFRKFPASSRVESAPSQLSSTRA